MTCIWGVISLTVASYFYFLPLFFFPSVFLLFTNQATVYTFMKKSNNFWNFMKIYTYICIYYIYTHMHIYQIISYIIFYI